MIDRSISDKLNEYVGKEISVKLKESSAYFHGADCVLDKIIDKYDTKNLFLSGVTDSKLFGILEGKVIELHFFDRREEDLAVEAKDLIKRYKCVENYIISIECDGGVIYKNKRNYETDEVD
ncbi:hypothetical protein HOK51_01885 [Candidatus Woesearchaeota archaeon]|jgi:hypothetical protein|nr:hypothetical protein [Candidatus Woesearchaeota archaeon]MBT6518566.1 hypothetical protein [Candidatus Woesearchaeota archaeon]MBT7366908.1 hypothetical protein [Candidatus Woesearchaeota archaeon]